MLALVDWKGEPPLEPNYGRSVFDVTVETLHYLRDGNVGLNLVRELGLDLFNSNVLTGLNLRRGQFHDVAEKSKQEVASLLSRVNLVKPTFRGREISPEFFDVVETTDSRIASYRELCLPDSIERESTVLVPNAFETGD